MENDPTCATVLGLILDAWGYAVQVLHGVDPARHAGGAPHGAHVVVIAVGAPRAAPPLSWLDSIRALSPTALCIAFTDGDPAVEASLADRGATLLRKPASLDTLRGAVETALGDVEDALCMA